MIRRKCSRRIWSVLLLSDLFSAFQFTGYLANAPETAMPLIVSLSSIESIFPSSIASFLVAPFFDFTSLLYALRGRFYLANNKLAMRLEPDFQPEQPGEGHFEEEQFEEFVEEPAAEPEPQPDLQPEA
jgi:hypothetical protein